MLLKKIQHIHFKEVLKGSALAFLLKSIGTPLSFLFNVLIARLFGAQITGLYFLGMVIIRFGALFGRFGFKNLLLKNISAYTATEDWPMVKGVYQYAMRKAFYFTIITIVILLLLTPILTQYIFSKPDLAPLLYWMIPALFPFVFFALYAECLRALTKIAATQFIKVISLPLFSIAVITILNTQPTDIAKTFLIACFITYFLAWLLWRSYTKHLYEVKAKTPDIAITNTNKNLFIIEISNFTIQWIPLVLLGVWYSSDQVGIYGMAFRTALLISVILEVVNSIAAAKFAALYKKNEIAELEKLVQKTILLMFIIALPIVIISIIFSKYIMAIYGQTFVSGYIALIILLLAQLVQVLGGLAGTLLVMSKYEKISQNNILISGFLTLFLAIILIPPYGLIGGALSTLIPTIVKNINNHILVIKHLGIKLLPF